jgi:hypothetical protein
MIDPYDSMTQMIQNDPIYSMVCSLNKPKVFLKAFEAAKAIKKAMKAKAMKANEGNEGHEGKTMKIYFLTNEANKANEAMKAMKAKKAEEAMYRLTLKVQANYREAYESQKANEAKKANEAMEANEATKANEQIMVDLVDPMVDLVDPNSSEQIMVGSPSSSEQIHSSLSVVDDPDMNWEEQEGAFDEEEDSDASTLGK